MNTCPGESKLKFYVIIVLLFISSDYNCVWSYYIHVHNYVSWKVMLVSEVCSLRNAHAHIIVTGKAHACSITQ